MRKARSRKRSAWSADSAPGARKTTDSHPSRKDGSLRSRAMRKPAPPGMAREEAFRDAPTGPPINHGIGRFPSIGSAATRRWLREAVRPPSPGPREVRASEGRVRGCLGRRRNRQVFPGGPGTAPRCRYSGGSEVPVLPMREGAKGGSASVPPAPSTENDLDGSGSWRGADRPGCVLGEECCVHVGLRSIDGGAGIGSGVVNGLSPLDPTCPAGRVRRRDARRIYPRDGAWPQEATTVATAGMDRRLFTEENLGTFAGFWQVKSNSRICCPTPTPPLPPGCARRPLPCTALRRRVWPAP